MGAAIFVRYSEHSNLSFASVQRTFAANSRSEEQTEQTFNKMFFVLAVLNCTCESTQQPVALAVGHNENIELIISSLTIVLAVWWRHNHCHHFNIDRPKVIMQCYLGIKPTLTTTNLKVALIAVLAKYVHSTSPIFTLLHLLIAQQLRDIFYSNCTAALNDSSALLVRNLFARNRTKVHVYETGQRPNQRLMNTIRV